MATAQPLLGLIDDRLLRIRNLADKHHTRLLEQCSRLAMPAKRNGWI